MSRSNVIPNRYSALGTCVEARKNMLDKSLLSLPLHVGYPVIVTAGETREDRDVLAEHADKLSKDANRYFLDAKVISQPNTDDIRELLVDPEVTSIAFLGDGNFSTFHMPQTKKGNIERVSWYNLARMATHLKQGVIEQRTCTMIHDAVREARVALASFIVSDQTRIISSVDKNFGNHCGFEEFNLQLTNVYDQPNNDRDQLRQPIGYTLPN